MWLTSIVRILSPETEFFIITMFYKTPLVNANSVDLGPHCFPTALLGVSRLNLVKWVKHIL